MREASGRDGAAPLESAAPSGGGRAAPWGATPWGGKARGQRAAGVGDLRDDDLRFDADFTFSVSVVFPLTVR